MTWRRHWSPLKKHNKHSKFNTKFIIWRPVEMTWSPPKIPVNITVFAKYISSRVLMNGSNIQCQITAETWETAFVKSEFLCHDFLVFKHFSFALWTSVWSFVVTLDFRAVNWVSCMIELGATSFAINVLVKSNESWKIRSTLEFSLFKWSNHHMISRTFFGLLDRSMIELGATSFATNLFVKYNKSWKMGQLWKISSKSRQN